MPTLRRIDPPDAMGDSGPLVQAIKYAEDGKKLEVVGDRPIVGCCLLVGSLGARSYQWQDWWRTSVITEIIEENEDYVIFKTKNSEYKFCF